MQQRPKGRPGGEGGGGGSEGGRVAAMLEGAGGHDHDAPLCVVCAMPFAVAAGSGGGQCCYVIGFAFLVHR